MLNQYTIGVLVPIWGDGPPAPPSHRAIGRVALELKNRGATLVFGSHVLGGRMGGWMVSQNEWVSTPPIPVGAVYDRFPSQSQPEAYAQIRHELGELPIFNDPVFIETCRDKLMVQRMLEARGIAMPAVEERTERFQNCLHDWGTSFLKPRFGSFGRGVVRVKHGQDLRPLIERTPVEFGPEVVLQRAVAPPDGWAGLCIRVLVQRLANGEWVFNPGVARCSETDAVVNAARGATVLPAADVLDKKGQHALDDILKKVTLWAERLGGGAHILEMGVDLVLGADGIPVLIEMNGRPRGRLAWLAQGNPEQFEATHRAAVMRPFERILALVY